MKVTSETTHNFDFPSKDTKRVISVKVKAKSEKEARAILTEDFMHALDQLEHADKLEKEAEEKAKKKEGTPSPVRVILPPSGESAEGSH